MMLLCGLHGYGHFYGEVPYYIV